VFDGAGGLDPEELEKTGLPLSVRSRVLVDKAANKE